MKQLVVSYRILAARAARPCDFFCRLSYTPIRREHLENVVPDCSTLCISLGLQAIEEEGGERCHATWT